MIQQKTNLGPAAAVTLARILHGPSGSSKDYLGNLEAHSLFKV